MISKIFRLLLRRKTKQIDEDTARLWQKRLSITYMLIGWNLAAYTIYICIKPHYPDLKGDDRCLKKATVMRFNGFKKIEEFEVINDELADVTEGVVLGQYEYRDFGKLE